MFQGTIFLQNLSGQQLIWAMFSTLVLMNTPATLGAIKVLSAEQNIIVIKLEWSISMTDFYHYANMWINVGRWIFLLLCWKWSPINKYCKSLSPKIRLSLYTWWRHAPWARELLSPRALQGSNDLSMLNLSTRKAIQAKWRVRVTVWESVFIIQCWIFMRWFDRAAPDAKRHREAQEGPLM